MEKLGYIGKIGKIKVFYEGSFYYVEINGKNYAVDWDKISKKRKVIQNA